MQKVHHEIGRLREAVQKVEAQQTKAEGRDEKYRGAQVRAGTWTARFTGLLVATSLIAGGISIWQSCLTRRNVDLTRQQFQSSQRPWVGFSTPIQVETFAIAENVAGEAKSTIQLGLTYQLENFGTQPARKVTIPTFTPAVTSDGIPPAGWQQKKCDFMEKMSNQSYYTAILMPKTSSGPIPGQTIAGSSTEVGKIKMAWIIGCIVYRDTIGGPIHHTRIILSAPASGTTHGTFYLYDSDAD